VIVPVLLFLTAASASPLATATRDAVASPHATMRELGRVPRASIPHNEEHEQRRSFAPRIVGNGGPLFVSAESVVTKPSIQAPRVTAGFAGTHEAGTYPSDAAGAVSAKYLLSASNAAVLAQDRTGTTLSNISLASFWHDLSFTDGTVYDSRVLYDNVADRWIICSLYDVNLKKATLLIAVSDGGNPSLGWHRYRYIVDPNDFLEADYTQMAMTRDAIVITANIFDFDFESSDVFIIRKSDAYAGAGTLPITQTPTSLQDLVPVDDREDALPYFVTQSGDVDLLVYSWNGGALTIVGNPRAPALNITSVSIAAAPQLGNSLAIEFLNIYVATAVMRNATLWVVTQPFGRSPLRSSVMWWRIALSSPLRVDTGVIDDPTGATMYAFPSIAVNKLGAALIGYSVFNASIYPSAGYSYIDPLNNLSTPAVLKAGDSSSTVDRWADFSTTVVDANDIDFWTTQTYSPIHTIGQSPNWTTWWGKIEAPPPTRRRAALH
jgi:hypothetical protein